jgi:hypothetical protein
VLTDLLRGRLGFTGTVVSDYNGIGWAESRQLVAVPMSLLAYTGLSGDPVMEPGPVELSAGSSSDDIRSSATVTVTGRPARSTVRTARSCPPRRSAPSSS